MFQSFLIITNNYTEQNDGQKYYTYKWNETYRNDFISSLRKDLHLLDQIVNLLNETVELFSTYISTRAQPFFEKCPSGRHTISFQDSNYKTQEKRFDNICTQKWNIYLEALRDFNCVKNDENRRKLWERKCDYKYFCSNVKDSTTDNYDYKWLKWEKLNQETVWKQFKRKNNVNTGNIKLSEYLWAF